MTARIVFLALVGISLSGIACAQQSQIPTIAPSEVKQAIDQGKDVVLFDVRRQEEIDKGVIDPSVLTMDYFGSAFKTNVAELDKSQTYYVYCHVGGRSGKTVQMMKDLGFKNVYNVDGGIVKWQKEGMKLVDLKK